MITETERVQAQTNDEWLDEYDAGKKLTKAEQAKATKLRTKLQNDAMWLWFTLVAEVLNSKGVYFKYEILSPKEIPFTKDHVHEYIWKPILLAWANVDSTRKMSTVDPSEIHMIICSHFATTKGITLPAFPNWRGEG